MDNKILFFRANFSLLIHRLCKLFKKEAYITTIAGIKVYGRKGSKMSFTKEREETLIPGDVLFFADGLKDKWSLTSQSINKSPHRSLSETIIEGKSIYDTEYVKREINGTLDGRFPLIINKKALQQHIALSKKCRKSVMDGSYLHPRVIFFENKYYVLDGKHRLAMAACLKKEMKCDIISAEQAFSLPYVQRIYEIMKTERDTYSKNMALLEAMAKQFTPHTTDEVDK